MADTTQTNLRVLLEGTPEQIGVQFCREVLLPCAMTIGNKRGPDAVLEFMTAVLVHTGLDAGVVFGQEVATIILNNVLRAVAAQEPCDTGERH